MGEIDYGEISQTISELNLHTKHFNKFNYTWNQTLFNLERPAIRTRAGKIVKSIRKKLLKIATSQNNLNNTYFPVIIESHAPSTASKKSVAKSSNKKFTFFPKINKQNSLAASLEDLETKIKNNKNFSINEVIKKNNRTEEFDSIQELFSLKNAMSESTLTRIKDFEDKVSKARNNLSVTFEHKSYIIPQIALKKDRAFRKIRATQYISNKFISKKKLTQKSESMKIKLHNLRNNPLTQKSESMKIKLHNLRNNPQ
ncbi:hypothetical protein SteCoe_19432 [Stentor coeruleus]|uniref:Uncharacterized protein n=1 Tax=Stentor coeruleus TaxID=5963 RepID=A0A1R2BUA1_9CILI|nr:hypothetical protein SteCoe_19432 [Stentor coeruleus]